MAPGWQIAWKASGRFRAPRADGLGEEPTLSRNSSRYKADVRRLVSLSHCASGNPCVAARDHRSCLRSNQGRISKALGSSCFARSAACFASASMPSQPYVSAR